MYRKCHINIADHVFGAVQAYDGESEQRRVELAKLRDVVGDLTARGGRPGGLRGSFYRFENVHYCWDFWESREW